MRHTDVEKELNDLSVRIIGAGLAVHSELGPGLLESTYEACLQHELTLRGLEAVRQVPIAISYKGLRVETAYRVDLLVNDRVVIEIKSVEALASVFDAQILTYLRLGRFPLGLMLNFNEQHLKDGIRRFVNSHRL